MAKKTKVTIGENETLVSIPEETKNTQPIEAMPADNIPENAADNQKDIFNTDGQLVVDVFETNSDFVVLATIAGVNIKDLDIAVEKDMMIIKGNRPNPHEGERKYFYQECYFGPFSRKIV